MLIGAVIVGLLTAFLVQAIHSFGNVEVGASMGIVFTVLFAFGLVLMRQAVDHVDIDPDCVLYGSIELAWFDQSPDGYGIPRGAIVNGVMLVGNLLVVLLFYKEFKITSFDPALAKSQGVHPSFMHYMLMTMTAATAVAAFETVGSILVVAMFIVPPATAYLLTNRYGGMFILAIGLSIIAAALGHVGCNYCSNLVWVFRNKHSRRDGSADRLYIYLCMDSIAKPRHSCKGLASSFNALTCSSRRCFRRTLALGRERTTNTESSATFRGNWFYALDDSSSLVCLAKKERCFKGCF